MTSKKKTLMETVSNTHKKQRGVVSSAGDQKAAYDNSVLLFKIEEQQKIIKELKTCVRTSEDKRKVLETRGKNLLAENQKLKALCNVEHSKALELQKKIQVQDKLGRMKDGYLKTKRRESSGKLKSSSKAHLVLKESSTQTLFTRESRNYFGKRQRTEGNGADLNPDMSKLEEDLQQLREVLYKREQTWTTIAERDRELRDRITMLTSELASVREIASLRSEDLHKRCIALKSTKDELGKAKKELLLLKQYTQRLKADARGQVLKKREPEEPPPVEEIPKVALLHK